MSNTQLTTLTSKPMAALIGGLLFAAVLAVAIGFMIGRAV